MHKAMVNNVSTITSNNPVLIIGCGRIGSAILSGLLDNGLKKSAVSIVDPYLDLIKSKFKVLPDKAFNNSLDNINKSLNPSIVIIAVKPAVMDKTLIDLKPFNLTKTVILSVAAGKLLKYFEDKLGYEQAIIRGMPNTPISVGEGITVCCSNDKTTQKQKKLCNSLLRTVSSVEWIKDESLMDAVTALSGSGPAYLFYLVEAMASAGEALGLPTKLSQKLASETISGSAALLKKSKSSATDLRKNVTSPGGTTSAALEVIMAEDGLAKIMRKAMQQAKARSKELAQ